MSLSTDRQAQRQIRRACLEFARNRRGQVVLQGRETPSEETLRMRVRGTVLGQVVLWREEAQELVDFLIPRDAESAGKKQKTRRRGRGRSCTHHLIVPPWTVWRVRQVVSRKRARVDFGQCQEPWRGYRLHLHHDMTGEEYVLFFSDQEFEQLAARLQAVIDSPRA